MKELNMQEIFNKYPEELRDKYFYLWSIKEPDAKVLFDTIQKTNARKIVIIGAYKGVSTLVALQAVNYKDYDYIINIDPFFNNYIAGDNYESIFDQALSGYKNTTKLKGFATTSGVEIGLHTKETKDGYKEQVLLECPKDFDLVFIDGDHSFPTCKNDFDVSLNRIRVGGKIVLHDTKSWNKDISQLLEHINTLPKVSIELFDGIDGMAVVTKNG
jgi:predicted O-methyltransferase YrrM